MPDLYRTVLTVPSDQAYLLYFLMESHEGICCYSTLPHSSTHLRSIEIIADPSTKPQVQHLLEQIREQKLFDYHQD